MFRFLVVIVTFQSFEIVRKLDCPDPEIQTRYVIKFTVVSLKNSVTFQKEKTFLSSSQVWENMSHWWVCPLPFWDLPDFKKSQEEKKRDWITLLSQLSKCLVSLIVQSLIYSTAQAKAVSTALSKYDFTNNLQGYCKSWCSVINILWDQARDLFANVINSWVIQCLFSHS